MIMKAQRIAVAAMGFIAALSVSVSAIDLRDVTFRTKTAGNVIFSHNDHIKKGRQKNDCRTCHDRIFSIKHPARYSMSDMERGKSCGACHNGREAFPLTECITCHLVRNLKISVKNSAPVSFTHQEHASRQPCTACHPRPFTTGKNQPVGMDAMERGKSCGVCHDGHKGFPLAECVKCHAISDIVIKVRETGPVTFTHKEHARRDSCKACHPKVYRYSKGKPVGMKAMEQGLSCGFCHNGKSAFAVKDCSGCHPVIDLSFPLEGISPARFSHKKHLANYSCTGCHPGLYQLGRGKPVGMAAMEKGASCGACHNGKDAFSVTATCESCH